MCDAFNEIEGGRTQESKEKEFLLKLKSNIAPVKVAVLPLVKNKEEITSKAKKVYNMLKDNFSCQYDETGAIGRRYRRQDEIGTPWAVTIDFESIANNDVTLRNRDTMEQQRVKISDLISIINENNIPYTLNIMLPIIGWSILCSAFSFFLILSLASFELEVTKKTFLYAFPVLVLVFGFLGVIRYGGAKFWFGEEIKIINENVSSSGEFYLPKRILLRKYLIL